MVKKHGQQLLLKTILIIIDVLKLFQEVQSGAQQLFIFIKNLLSFSSFMPEAYAILREWSYSRDTDQKINAKPLIDEPSTSLSQRTEAY
jgi:hypothetical protein